MVAIEEMPDEGLDQPLRLDKLVNEVDSHNASLPLIGKCCKEQCSALQLSSLYAPHHSAHEICVSSS